MGGNQSQQKFRVVRAQKSGSQSKQQSKDE